MKRTAGGMVADKDSGKAQAGSAGDDVAEKEARLKRIQEERVAVPRDMRKAYEDIVRFRGEIREFKDSTYKLSKKFIMDLEDAAKKDRIAWMQRAHEFE